MARARDKRTGDIIYIVGPVGQLVYRKRLDMLNALGLQLIAMEE